MDKIIKVSLLVLALVALSYGRRHDHGADEESNSTCESQEIEEDYDLPLHVGSIFIQIGVSTISVFVPSILHRLHISLKSGVFVIISDILKFFGTGIIISTAFIHLLPAAFEQFGNECLTGVWADYGVGWVGVFAMIAAFAMQIIEFTALCKLDQMKREKSDSKLRLPESQDMEHPTGEIESQEAKHPHLISDKDNGHVHGLALVDDKDVRGLSIYILELGIALHSVLIGVTLSNTSGGEFVSLLIALIFHQSFEGLALGTRIVGGSFKLTRTLLLSSVYGLATPIGIAIGIGVRYSYHPNSVSAIVSIGILESISAGILLYNSFVGLIAGEMNLDHTIRSMSLRDKAIRFGSMYLGVIAMSVVGNWA